MSRRSSRGTERIDYKLYSETGVKVPKESRSLARVRQGFENLAKMATQELIDDELKLSFKFKRLLEEYELNLLFDISEIETGISEIKEVVEKYENVHVELRRELENTYAEKYPKFAENLKPMTDWIVNAKLEIKNRKIQRMEEEKVKEEREELLRKEIEEKEKADQLSKEEEQKKQGVKQEKEKLRTALRHVNRRIDLTLNSITEEDSIFVEDMERNINSVRDLIKEYSELFIKIETVFGKDFEAQFSSMYEKNDHMCKFLSQLINMCQNTKHEKLKHLEAEEKTRKGEQTRMHAREFAEKVDIFEEIFLNIKERMTLLWSKCTIDLLSLSDSEVLQKHKDTSLDSEFSEILDRVTKLVKSTPPDYHEAKGSIDQVHKGQEELKNQKKLFQENLKLEVKKRDLSEEKMKNASILGIKIPKFKGYDSSIDFYTFKSEFERLIVPKVQAMLLPDHLKSNYLDGQALQIVKEIENIDEIWDRLRLSFGNVNILLAKKLKVIERSDPLWKLKNDEKIIQSITKVINIMKELTSLAKKHNIEASLFHSSNLAKIYFFIGIKRQTDIMKKLHDFRATAEDSWSEIIRYLDRELKVKEQILLFNQDNPLKSEVRERKGPVDKNVSNSYSTQFTNNKCVICEKTDHVPTITKNGNSFINYFACEKFVKMNPKQRFEELRKKHLCFQCLTPGLKANHEGVCFDKYKCPDHSHSRFKSGLHILICDRHKEKRENLDLLEIYKEKCITNSRDSHRDFSKNIGISFHVRAKNDGSYKSDFSDGEGVEEGMYMLQTIKCDDHRFNIFYDSGCGNMVCKKSAVETLTTGGRANHVVKGPITLTGVGEQKSICEYGMYRLRLPLQNGREANFVGICIDKITGTFPSYPLKEMEKDIHQAYATSGKNPNTLPKLPNSVGGDTDIMIGVTYFKYFPKFLFNLPNGLSIYESKFASPDGSRGVIAGPHSIVTRIHQNLGNNYATTQTYFEKTVQVYRNGFRVGLDASLLRPGLDEIDDQYIVFDTNSEQMSGSNSQVHVAKRPPKSLKKFEDAESVGTDLSYRCVKCRGCPNCLKSKNIECISTQNEVEQEMINRSVKVDLAKSCSKAHLPFLSDPVKKLAPNKEIAKKVYNCMIKSLNNRPEDKNDVLKAEKKLQNLGFVDYFENLCEEEKQVIKNSPLLHFLPWRVVWNDNSLSTPCRPIFDASLPTPSGLSLNDIIAKGKNNMNQLLQILIRWRVKRYAYHTDLQNMYNRVGLEMEHWCYQLYLFHEDLNPSVEPQIKVFKTLSYGVKSSGNQAERAIRETANLQKAEYPRECEIVNEDTYVDDCISGENSIDDRNDVTDNLIIVLSKGGFNLKGFTFSGFDPPEHLSKDGKSITVAGMNWVPKSDFLSLNISSLNFSKKHRGKKSQNLYGVIPEKFTRRDCAGRVGEIFDPIGRFTPITAAFKLDLSELCSRGLDWDDQIPPDLKIQWLKNFDTISKLKEIKFRRAIVPDDAINLGMETIEMSDASQNLACSALYARFKRRNGTYSCQLLFARSKVLPKNMSIPRSELFAAALNATTGHVVNLALGKSIVRRTSLTDSQIALYWISNSQLQLKQWTRNRVIEINRLTNKQNWFYIDTKNMTADIGTKKGAGISDILDDSRWVSGEDWAQHDSSLFPIKSVNELKLSHDDLKAHSEELLKSNVIDDEWINEQLSKMYSESYSVYYKNVLDMVRERYIFSNYVIDPNKFRLRKVVRILALIMLFVDNLKLKINKISSVAPLTCTLPSQFDFDNDMYLVTNGVNKFPFVSKRGLVVQLSADYVKKALNYFFRKATLEIKNFVKQSSYKSICVEKNDMLMYTGRILPSQTINNQRNLSDVCEDLSTTSFCVPLVDKLSPLAYAIVNEVHWFDYDACHSGNETVMRFVLKIAFIIEGRPLIHQFRSDCPRCRFLNKKSIDVAMGPKSDDNLCIAPAFYVSQVDMFGPFNAYSYVNKRATIKIWFVMFVCCTTGAVDIKVMEDSNTSSFVLAFTRFACKVGYPKKLLPDGGSQLVKGCKDTTITLSDIRGQLHEVGVSFEVCPPGAHYMHGKVERKIRHVKESFERHLTFKRLSVIQWESLGDQVANSINNLPIGIGNQTKGLEHIDLITPNRLLLSRNNDRCPVGTLSISDDLSKIIEKNNEIFRVWFQAWLISCVPSLMFQPKWFRSDRDPKVGDIVLFLKSEKEFAKTYQYGIISGLTVSRDNKIRQIEVEYRNANERTTRRVMRGTREVVIIHKVNEIGLVRELNLLCANVTQWPN